MKDISLFFGAGAEMCYGLPSGGKFALDIFRMDTIEDKKTSDYKETILIKDHLTLETGYLKIMIKNLYPLSGGVNMKV